MPNRIIREGILSSDRVEMLDPPAEVFYRRLMSKVDDHGLYDARPSILRTSLYPLRVDRVREADIARWIAACEKAGVIALYQHDGKPYLQMLDTRWQARSEAKYPLPPENTCKQVSAAEHLDVVVVGDVDVIEDVDVEKKARKRATSPPLAKPEDVSEQTWGDWLRLRKGKRAVVSETVVLEARREAAKAKLPLERFLTIWCARGSQGLQADWLKQNERSPANPTPTFRERDAIAAAARVHEITGGLVAAKTQKTEDVEEIFDATPRLVG